MVKSMTGAIAGLRTHQSKMDVISNNIANVNTWGYKTRTANFEDSIYQNVVKGSGGDAAGVGTGGINSSQLGFGVNLSSISTNFTTGAWGYTGDGMNAMIDGTGFFIVGSFKDPIAGTAPAADEAASIDILGQGLSLSRVGILAVDDEGYLVDNKGNYIFGFAITNASTPADPNHTAAEPTLDKANLVPLKIPTLAAATGTDPAELYQLQSMSILTDGTVVGIDMEDQKITLGKIGIAAVQNVNGLDQTAGYLYNIGNNAGTVNATEAGQGTLGSVLSNYLEMSNVDLATEIANMITTQRGYQANTKMITVTDEMLAELVNMK